MGMAAAGLQRAAAAAPRTAMACIVARQLMFVSPGIQWSGRLIDTRTRLKMAWGELWNRIDRYAYSIEERKVKNEKKGRAGEEEEEDKITLDGDRVREKKEREVCKVSRPPRPLSSTSTPYSGMESLVR